MTNKIKEIIRRGMCLILALTMMVPTGAYGASDIPVVSSWNEYKEVLRQRIIGQEGTIIINFDENANINADNTTIAKYLINYAYEEVLASLPKYYGELNIKSQEVEPILFSTNIKSVTHKFVYNRNITTLEAELIAKVNEAKNQATDYDKIKFTYDYIRTISSDLRSEDYSLRFAIIMDKLGYDNDIVVGTFKSTEERHLWNLVKVQGAWYHVDTFLAAKDTPDNKYLLTSDEFMEKNYTHKWPKDPGREAESIYDSANKLDNEMKYIAKEKVYSADMLLTGITSEANDEIDEIIDEGYIESQNTKDLVNALKDNLLKTELNTIINEIAKVKSGKDKIVILEALVSDITREKLDEAKGALIQVSTKYPNIKLNLSNRIGELEERLDMFQQNELNAKAIAAVDKARLIITDLLQTGSLDTLIANAETAVKEAETAVKLINDISVKDSQLARIKDINTVIVAIKAVNKAETVKPYKMTNVDSARNTILKIRSDYQDTIINTIDNLNARLSIIETAIKTAELVTKATKAVEKAEKYLKRPDYIIAKALVEDLKVIGDSQTAEYLSLTARLILVDEAIINAEEVAKATTAVKKAESSLLQKDVDYAESLVYGLKVADARVSLINRLNAVQEVINATEAVIKLEKIYDDYIKGYQEVTEEMVIEEVTDLEIMLSNLATSSTFAKAIKSLQSRVKVISDKLILEDNYNYVNSLLAAVENNIVIDLLGNELLDKTITRFENELIKIDEAAKKVTEKSLSTEIKNRLTAIKDVIAAIQSVNLMGSSDESSILKTISAADKAAGKLSDKGIYTRIGGIVDFKTTLQDRVNLKKAEVEAANKAAKARAALDKAISTMTESYIKAAIEAVAKVDESLKSDLIEEIKVKIIEALLKDADNKISTAITNIGRADKSVATNISEVKKAVPLAYNMVAYSDDKLGTDFKNLSPIEIILKDQDESIDELDLSFIALKAVQDAEKAKTQSNVDKAKIAIGLIPTSKDKYKDMISKLNTKLSAVQTHIDGEDAIVEKAEELVADAEGKLGADKETNPSSKDINTAQNAVNLVNDKTKKANFQKRIDAINTAMAAKLAVDMAEAYTDAASVNAADKAINALVKTGMYLDIANELNEKVGELKNKLNISKLVEEATNLVQKAVESRLESDSVKARFKVESIKEFVQIDGPDNDPYDKLITMLNDLDLSIKEEAKSETAALELATQQLELAIKEISGEDGVNIDIGKIVEPIDKDAIIKAYARIQKARNYIITANATAKKLTNQKSLLEQISNASKEVDLAEDNIDVKESIRLVSLASNNVMNANTEEKKALAKLDISAARRAIDKIGHSNNKSIKVTITNTINSIENKLVTNNDQDLINAAVEAVNHAADLVTKAVTENNVRDPETQEEVDKAIFSAKLAIGWISDNSKAAKATLTIFITEIEATFKAEIDGIDNDKRMTEAEEFVEKAEKTAKEGTGNLDSDIRLARLKISMIKTDGIDSEIAQAKILELSNRLDILEGKTPGSGGTPGGGGTPGNGSSGGGTKPGGSSSGGIKIPLDALPDSKRIVGVADPNWGDTKKLKNSFSTVGISVQDMNAYRVLDNKLKILELSNLLNTLNNPKSVLIVRGKNILTDSAPYLKDKQNNNILFPVKILGDEFGFSISLVNNPVIGGSKKLSLNGIVNGEIKSILLEIGSEFGQVNGTYFRLSSKPLIQDGRTYIPLDFLVEHLGINFSYFNDKGNLQLIMN